MISRDEKLRTLLDAGVPDSVAKVLTKHGHTAILYREVLPEKVADEVVCATALANNAILVAVDGDLKRLAKQYGVTPRGDRFNRLHVIRLCSNETQAATRLEQSLSLIEHEWQFVLRRASRRLWVDVAGHFIRTYR